jgi:hypothetical protein
VSKLSVEEIGKGFASFRADSLTTDLVVKALAEGYTNPGPNPANLCPHGLAETGDCDDCRAEYEQSELDYQAKLDREEREHCAMLDSIDEERANDPYEFEPFFEVAL